MSCKHRYQVKKYIYDDELLFDTGVFEVELKCDICGDERKGDIITH